MNFFFIYINITNNTSLQIKFENIKLKGKCNLILINFVIQYNFCLKMSFFIDLLSYQKWT